MRLEDEKKRSVLSGVKNMWVAETYTHTARDRPVVVVAATAASSDDDETHTYIDVKRGKRKT